MVLLSSCSGQSNSLTARDLFYHDLNKQGVSDAGANNNAAGAMNAAYRLELARGDNPPVMVNNGFTFRSGDKVRLYVKVSTPVYAYVLATGSSGKKQLLYPPSGEDNHLEGRM